MGSNGSSEGKSEEKMRNYRFVLVVPSFGREEDAERVAGSILSILSTRLHREDIQIEDFGEAEQTFVRGV